MIKTFLSLLLFFSIVNCQDWASKSGGFLRMGISARSIAMGGGFTAELDKSFATFHNPCLLYTSPSPRD